MLPAERCEYVSGLPTRRISSFSYLFQATTYSEEEKNITESSVNDEETFLSNLNAGIQTVGIPSNPVATSATNEGAVKVSDGGSDLPIVIIIAAGAGGCVCLCIIVFIVKRKKSSEKTLDAEMEMHATPNGETDSGQKDTKGGFTNTVTPSGEETPINEPTIRTEDKASITLGELHGDNV